MNPPTGLEPLEWLLVTTLEINDFDQACQLKVLWPGWRRLFDISQTWLIFNTS
jgi:hypothetical protein